MLSIIDNGETSKIDDELLGTHLFWVEPILDDLEEIVALLTSGQFSNDLSLKE